MRRAAELHLDGDSKLTPAKAAEGAFREKKGAHKFVEESGVGNKSVEEQVEFALALQKALVAVVAEDEKLDVVAAGKILSAMLQQLYDLEILADEGILGWWQDKRSQVKGTMEGLRARCKVIIDWLQEDDESEADEEQAESGSSSVSGSDGNSKQPKEKEKEVAAPKKSQPTRAFAGFDEDDEFMSSSDEEDSGGK